jgi:hypothetical protein
MACHVSDLTGRHSVRLADDFIQVMVNSRAVIPRMPPGSFSYAATKPA